MAQSHPEEMCDKRELTDVVVCADVGETCSQAPHRYRIVAHRPRYLYPFCISTNTYSIATSRAHSHAGWRGINLLVLVQKVPVLNCHNNSNIIYQKNFVVRIEAQRFALDALRAR